MELVSGGNSSVQSELCMHLEITIQLQIIPIMFNYIFQHRFALPRNSFTSVSSCFSYGDTKAAAAAAMRQEPSSYFPPLIQIIPDRRRNENAIPDTFRERHMWTPFTLLDKPQMENAHRNWICVLDQFYWRPNALNFSGLLSQTREAKEQIFASWQWNMVLNSHFVILSFWLPTTLCAFRAARTQHAELIHFATGKSLKRKAKSIRFSFAVHSSPSSPPRKSLMFRLLGLLLPHYDSKEKQVFSRQVYFSLHSPWNRQYLLRDITSRRVSANEKGPMIL